MIATTTIRTRRHGMTAELAKAVDAARAEDLRVADASTPAPEVTHEPVPSEFERVFGIRSGRKATQRERDAQGAT